MEPNRIMEQLITALQGAKAPGVYRVSLAIAPDELAALCMEADAQVFYLDGARITHKDPFLKEVALAMNFPDYFGGNWDAFADCLTDVDADGMSRMVLLYSEPEHFCSRAPQEWAIALEILQEAIAFWQTQDMPMYVLLQTENPSFQAIAPFY
jgi:hypothetical protein